MKIYIVSRNGKFLDGSYWQDKLEDARIYKKIGPAKARVTYFYRFEPQLGCPTILEFELDLNLAKTIDLTKNTGDKIKRATEIRLKRELEYKAYQKKCLEEDKRRIEERLKNL